MKRFLLIAIALVLIPTAFAQTFTWNSSVSVTGTIFQIEERANFSYDLNVTVGESIVRYSRQLTNLSLSINNGTGIITYTPPSNEIGYHLEGVIFISENISNGLEFITIKYFFNVTNVNDEPNISAYAPYNLSPSILENTTLLFNITATDPDLSYGDTINISWYIDSGLIQSSLSNTTLNSTLNFTATFCNASSYNITVKITDLNNTFTSLTWNLTVNNTNRPPQLNMTLANITWLEDNNLLNNITLNDFFYDPDADQCSGSNQDNLTFNTNLTFGVGGNSNINISIDQNSSNVSFYPILNFAGNETVNFTANDSFSTVSSNPIVLTLINVNDPPVLSTIGNLTAAISVLYTRLVGATDPDILYGDSLTWTTNSTIFNLTAYNATHVAINFTPSISDIGNYSIHINVSDFSGINDTETFIFTVQNNTPPILDSIFDKNATQDIVFLLDVNATDGDGDNITFTSNSTIFSISTINGTLGRVSFTPTNDDVGNFSILFTATDVLGAVDTQAINFSVLNVNDPPSLNTIVNLSVKVNRTLLYNITGDDVDIIWGDVLLFWTNTTMFNLTKFNTTAALLNFSPNVTQVGNHSIMVIVNDTAGSSANRTFLLTVFNSSIPILTYIGNHTIFENEYLNLTINATEADEDVIVFTINSTTLNTTTFNFTNVSGLRALFNGTPDQYEVGNHTFHINVTDVDGNFDMEEFTIEVLYVDDAPILIAIGTININENSQLLRNLTAYDEEYSLFGADLNLTFFHNSTLYGFNFSERSNATAVLLNFSTTSSQVGSYSINITVSDGNSNTSEIITLNVINVNDAPNVSTYNPSLTPSIAENLTIYFGVNATDVDMTLGDNISANWFYDGTNQTHSFNSSWTSNNATFAFHLLPSFCSNGTHNLTARIMDSSNSTVSVQWNLTITNVNRVPEWGVKRHTTTSDFGNGTLTNVSATNSTGNVTLRLFNATHYDSFGNFTSQVIDFGSKFRFSEDVNITAVNSIEWDSTVPAGTNLTIYYRWSVDGSAFSSWIGPYTGSPQPFVPQTVRYIQYKALFNASSDASFSPTLREVRVRYTIKNITVLQNTRYTNIIDLNDYITDPDTSECTGSNKDPITRSVTGNDSVLLTISSGVITIVEHGEFAGSDTVQFTGNDTFNLTIGDDVVITVEENTGGSIPSTSTSSGGGGGGGGSSSSLQIQQQTRVRNVSVPLALDIIVPKPVVVYRNESVSVPISLINHENFTLFDIYLSVDTPNGSIRGIFSTDYIATLKPEEKVDTTLLIESFASLGTYEIVVKANVSDPSYVDRASFFVSSIEQGRTNDSEFNTRITFARDLITNNPECLELEEQIQRVQDAIGRGSLTDADALLTQTIDDCRYLLSIREDFTEQPAGLPISVQMQRILRSPITIGGIALAVLIVLGLLVYRFASGSKELPNRKLSQEEEEIAVILGIRKKK